MHALGQTAPLVEGLAKVYKQFERDTGQPLVGNSAKGAVFDALDHAAQALAEAGPGYYGRPATASDIPAAVGYLNNEITPDARRVLDFVSGAAHERSIMAQDYWTLIGAEYKIRRGENIPADLAEQVHESSGRLESSHPDLMARIQALNNLLDGERRNGAVVAAAVEIADGRYDLAEHRHVQQALEQGHISQPEAELSR